MKILSKIALLTIVLLAASGGFAQAAAGGLDEGVALYDQGKYAEAADALGKLVAADRENRRAWLYLGMSRARLKNNSEAVKALKQADKLKAVTVAAEGVKITSKPRASYTDAARGNLTQGTVKLAVEFGADGKIKAVVPFQKLPDGLTENCVAAAKGIVFDPATKDGKPISAIGIVTYSFTIY